MAIFLSPGYKYTVNFVNEPEDDTYLMFITKLAA